MSKAVMCIANTEAQAGNIVTRLKEIGVAESDISVLFPDKTATRDFAHEQNTKAPEGASVGGSAGGLTGGVLGWLAGIGLLAIPGVGPFVAAGPIMAALSGAAVGAALGGIAGGLIGMGIPEYEAKQYEAKIRDGNILISVHVLNSDEAKIVKEIFEEGNADDISVTSESGVSDSNRAEGYRPTAHFI